MSGSRRGAMFPDAGWRFDVTLMRKAFAAATLAIIAVPAGAVTVTSVEIRSASQSMIDKYLQIGELQLFQGATNVALGVVGSATSVYFEGAVENATDGTTLADYPDIFHSGNPDGSDVFTLTFASAVNVERISIFGREGNPCCDFRDIYAYTLLNGGATVASGILDARATNFATAAVPEPAAWALMIGGMGLAAGSLRARRRTVKFAAA